MAIEKPYKCTATFRGFDKILTQKFLYLQVGKHLKVETCNVASLVRACMCVCVCVCVSCEYV